MIGRIRRDFFSRNARAFTLVELLVVIGIVAVLAALIMPAVNKMLAKGRTTKSVSQLKQIYGAIAQHVAENDGNYPYGYGAAGGLPPGGNDRDFWYNVVKVRLYPHPTIANRSILEGPTGYLPISQQNLTGTVLRSPNVEKNSPVHVASYGYNDRFKYILSRPQKLGLMYSNARTVLLADNQGNTHSLTPDNASSSGKLNARNSATKDNANDGNCIAVFLDGHSEMLSAELCTKLNNDKTNEFWGVAQ